MPGLRSAAGLAALLLLAWAAIDPYFRDAEGLLSARICLPLALASGLALLGFAWRTRWRPAVLWLVLAITGQAAALQLIDAGPFVRYQHYRILPATWDRLALASLAIVGVQAIAVAFAFRRAWRPLRDWLAATYRPWHLGVIAFAFITSSAVLSRQPTAYLRELLFATLIQSLGLANVIMVARALPAEALASIQKMTDRLLGQSGSEGGSRGAPGLDRYVLGAAAWVVIVAGLLAYFVYQRHPHVPDEVVYLYHARYFAEGMLTMPGPPVQPAFELNLMFYQPDRWFSPVPPGWPAMLALGVLLGAPWLVNPLLGGVNVLLVYLLLADLYPRRTARLAVLLLAASPWFVFMSMNLMTHTFTLTCALVAAVCMTRLRRTAKLRWAWIGGFAIGMASLIRPLEGLAVAIVLGLWALTICGRRLRFAPVLVLALGSILVGAITLPYNKHLIGEATRFPLIAYTDEHYGPGTNALGFGPQRGLGWPLDASPGHGAKDVLANAALNTFAVNVELLGWASGSLLIIALFLLSRRLKRSDYFMVAAVAVVVGLHSLYWFSGGPDFGARYWYLIIVPCAALAARGLEFLGGVGDSQAADTPRYSRALAAAFALSLASLLTFFPWRALDKYFHYRGMRPDVRELAATHRFGRSLVLIRGRRHPDYASAAIYNPIDLKADGPIYAWDRSPEVRAKVLEEYADRRVWVLEGPSVTGSAFRVVAGPVPASDLEPAPKVIDASAQAP